MRTNKPNPFSARLDREWKLMRGRPHLVERARRWGVTDAAFTDLDRLLALAGHRTDRSPEANAMLGRLVDAGRRDRLAARIVLQRLLPGLLAVVRRRRTHEGCDGELEELVGAAWLAIANYRTDRRPDRIAANLVGDAKYAAFTAPSRRLSATEVLISPGRFDDIPAEIVLSPCEELAELLASARAAGLPSDDLDLVRLLLRAGSASLVASECQVTPRTVRNRRDRATTRLRTFALAA